MNTDRLEGKWKQMSGKVKEQWGKLTDDDLHVINGKTEQLVGRVQERYGIAREEARKQVDAFLSSSTFGPERETTAEETTRRREQERMRKAG